MNEGFVLGLKNFLEKSFKKKELAWLDKELPGRHRKTDIELIEKRDTTEFRFEFHRMPFEGDTDRKENIRITYAPKSRRLFLKKYIIFIKKGELGEFKAEGDRLIARRDKPKAWHGKKLSLNLNVPIPLAKEDHNPDLNEKIYNFIAKQEVLE